MRDLRPLFDPDTVAVVGASPDSFYSANLVDNLLDYGFGGELRLVNPSRDEAWGRPCYDDVGDVPGDVDLAVVAVPRDHVLDVVRSAGERGVPAALVITAGFAEADETGAELEAELAAAADRYGIDVAGPNCIGLANARDGVVLASTCSRRPEAGNVGLVSQSGALAFTTFYERATDEDVRFSHVVSTGNEADLGVPEFVEYLSEQSAVDVICAYVEGVDDPNAFVRAADRAVREGTPVLAVKVGRSDTAEAATLSHTGALTGDDAAWDAAFRQSGVQRVADIPDLLGQANAHVNAAAPDGDRLCVVSTSGGLASLLADMADERGLRLPAVEGATERALLDVEELLTFGGLDNPVDVRGYGAEVLDEIAEPLLADERFDAYVFAVGLSAVDDRAERIATQLREIDRRADDPVFALWTGRKEQDDPTSAAPYERLREDAPLYYDPSRCMDAVASTVRHARTRERLTDRPSRRELEASVGDPVGDLRSDAVLAWREAADLLAAYDVPTVETRVVGDAESAAAAAADVGFPVVVKVDSPALPHRTDVGAVVTDVATPDEARDAFETVSARARRHVSDDDVEGVLIQPQVEAPVEAMVGVAPDRLFGSLVSVGTGGTAVEALDDSAVAVPPLSRADARDAVDETLLSELLADRRDGPDLPVDDLADLVADVGTLAATEPVAELDLNPVLVGPNGVVAVDALVRTR